MFLGFEALGMSGIGEAPEDRIVLGGSSTVLLSWEVLIYAATHEYISRVTDTPPTQAFSGTLEKGFRLDRSLIGSTRIGEQITIGLGEVRLTNLERDYDHLASDTTPLGQLIIIRYGDRNRPYSEWRTVLVGYMVDQQIDRDGVTFRVRDAGHLLDVPVSANVYLGTGGREGGDDLKNKRKPRVFGWVLEWTAPLVIPASLAYQLNDGQIHAVQKCRVRGVEQTFVGDYATVELMNAATLTVGQYATCLAEGWGRIGVAVDTELGQVTWDFAGDKAGGVFAETTADIVERLITSATVVTADGLVGSTFDTLNGVQPAPIGYGIPAGDEQQVSRAVARIMAGAGGWCGSRRNGKFEVRRFEAPAGVPAARFDRLNLADVKLGVLPAEISPPPWRVRVGWGRIWTPGQTNLAGSVSEAYRAFLADEIRLASQFDIDIKNDFPPGRELVEDQTFFRDEADADAEAARKLALFGESRSLYVLPLMEKLYVFEPGQVVHVQWVNEAGEGRFDLAAGKLARIVKLTEDDVDGVEMTVFA
jgi:hypothetical protein